jgi:uncharacterized pyridoxal phosphate-containing UPF0001 family protein
VRPIGIVGENRIQEALEKMDHVVEPVEWHLIGHLQRNKVKHLDRFAMFHALDSERLAIAISERAVETGRRTPVLVQVNASGEQTKGGFGLDDLRGVAPRLAALPGLEVKGTMTMAPYEAPEKVLRESSAAVVMRRKFLPGRLDARAVDGMSEIEWR